MSHPYRRTKGRDEAARTLLRLGAAACLAGALGACSFALPSFMGGEAPEETTGSIARVTPEARLSADLSAEDWRRAKAALGVALDPQGNGRAVNWDNPETKVTGDITPLGSPFVEDDEICRRFTAGVETPAGKVSRFAGRACRVSGDDWRLTVVNPAL